MKENCKSTCGWCPPELTISGNKEESNKAFCFSDETFRNMNLTDVDYSEYSDYDDDYDDETTAKVEDYPVSSKSGKYSIYDENGNCQVFGDKIISIRLILNFLGALSETDSSPQPCHLSKSKSNQKF